MHCCLSPESQCLSFAYALVASSNQVKLGVVLFVLHARPNPVDMLSACLTPHKTVVGGAATLTQCVGSSYRMWETFGSLSPFHYKIIVTFSDPLHIYLYPMEWLQQGRLSLPTSHAIWALREKWENTRSDPCSLLGRVQPGSPTSWVNFLTTGLKIIREVSFSSSPSFFCVELGMCHCKKQL